jgi:hypothetical protein
MSAMGHKRTYAVQKGMSALPLIATVKADTEADAVPKTRAPGAPVGREEVVWTANPTPKYAGLLWPTSREFCLQ